MTNSIQPKTFFVQALVSVRILKKNITKNRATVIVLIREYEYSLQIFAYQQTLVPCTWSCVRWVVVVTEKYLCLGCNDKL